MTVKRLFDIAFSAAVLILLSPLFLAIGTVIRLTSRGPAIYRQERVGRFGIPFRCCKFRTMYADADARLHDILASDPAKQREWDETHKLKDDPRITPIGSFLRKTSLDELPQFWNVLMGDLSVVGPRPVTRTEIVKHFGPKAEKILSLRPGITGLWQISGRSDLPYSARIALDESYCDNRTFFLDMKMIVLTIPKILSRKGAY